MDKRTFILVFKHRELLVGSSAIVFMCDGRSTGLATIREQKYKLGPKSSLLRLPSICFVSWKIGHPVFMYASNWTLSVLHGSYLRGDFAHVCVFVVYYTCVFCCFRDDELHRSRCTL